MTFTRRKAKNWHQEVPGARWFKTDLHIHTIDDFPGGRAKLPADISRLPESVTELNAYARRFLQSAVERSVRVLGLTPHSPRIGTDTGASAVWAIVEEWNQGDDDDGVPFREKLYAVFPGFEPSLKQGKAGLHLLFLFDPEIGRKNYLKAFDLTMGGVEPWRNQELQISNKSADEVFRELREYHGQNGQPQWSYITLAPHIDNKKGLLGALNAQVLKNFSHEEVTGLELGDEKLPEDALKNRDWLPKGMAAYHQAFFHGSDAYSVNDIGKRHTWLKLASPRIEALRQAFIASDSRIRIGYERDASNALIEIANPPDVTVKERPWLKSVTVTGKASFFGTTVDGKQGIRFDLSPDLTCIIGGSMTGKSTFLDGLRVHINAPLPNDESILQQVKDRALLRFLGGSPKVCLECPGRDPTASHYERWPAVFFAQNELQRLAQESEAVEELLARLVPTEMEGIQERREKLISLDKELSRAVQRLGKLDEDLAVAEQALERTKKASAQLAAFSQAGVEKLHQASRDLRRWQETTEISAELEVKLSRLLNSMEAFEIPEIDERIAVVLQGMEADVPRENLQAQWNQIRKQLLSAKLEIGDWNVRTKLIENRLEVQEQHVRTEVDRALADLGLDGARIEEFKALNRQASLLESYKANLEQVRGELHSGDQSFESQLEERQRIVDKQRAAFDRVFAAIRIDFEGRISARRIDDGSHQPLERFLKKLSKRGITRWWNELEDWHRPTPAELLEHLQNDTLNEVEMSGAVQKTFWEQLTRTRRRALASIRCSDHYLLELRLDDGNHRRLDDLSGGQRVSLLLSLLLETTDERPLVIDQPEDELDNRFLFDTVLPALKRLKGRRQIIVATHNANIVVNGDADQVIQLEATANKGRIACAGAIEDPDVRDAIVRTVDGGDEAFRLRRLKYGF